MIYQDRLETNLLQLFAHGENWEWFSIISYYCWGQHCCWTCKCEKNDYYSALLHSGVDPANTFRGAISVIFGSQVLLRVHCCKTDEVYFTAQLWQNNGRQSGLVSRVLFSEL